MTKRKLERTAENLELIRRILVNGIWVAIILVVLAGVGWLVVKSPLTGVKTEITPESTQRKKLVTPEIDWSQVNESLLTAMKSAREEARTYADHELNNWIAGLMQRVDESFLDWYFSYWTQQLLGLKGLYQYGVHYVINNQPTASEKLTEEIQAEFSQRVLRPQISQRVIERIIHETAAIYVRHLRQQVDQIPQIYGISRVEWQNYLEDIAITTASSEGGRQTPLTLKALTVSGVSGTALLATNIKGLVSKISTKVMSTSSGKVTSAMAAKTGSKVAAKVGGKFFGTIAGIGVLVWDVWDHNVTKKENRPFLRQALQDYFSELKLMLLEDSDFGVLAPLLEIERKVVNDVAVDRTSMDGVNIVRL